MVVSRNSFYFVRHGESEYNANPHSGVGHDSNLTERGKSQASCIEPIIAKLTVQTICVSPLKRAVQTQEIITKNLNCPVVIIDELRECTEAIWFEMNRFERNPEMQVNEETRQFVKRVLTGINRALEHVGPVLIVAHGGIHFAMCQMMKIFNYEKDITNCGTVHFAPVHPDAWQAKVLF